MVRLIARQHPDVINGLIRCNKVWRRWITSDQVLMKELTEVYQSRIYDAFNAQVQRLFHIVPSNNKEVVNVYIKHERNHAYCAVNYAPSTPTNYTWTKKILDVQLEMKNPQSQQALREIWWLHRRHLGLSKYFRNERSQNIDDIAQGITYVLQAKPIPPIVWPKLLKVCIVIETFFLIVMSARRMKSKKLGFLVVLAGMAVAAFACDRIYSGQV